MLHQDARRTKSHSQAARPNAHSHKIEIKILSTNKKFIIIFSTPPIKTSCTFHFFQLQNKKFVHKIFWRRTTPRPNVRVNVLARSNVLAQTNENEIVLLRNYKSMLNYKISFYKIEFYHNILYFMSS